MRIPWGDEVKRNTLLKRRGEVVKSFAKEMEDISVESCGKLIPQDLLRGLVSHIFGNEFVLVKRPKEIAPVEVLVSYIIITCFINYQLV